MEDLINNLLANAPDVGTAVCYAIICVVLLLTGCGLPVPEDLPLLASGVLCQMKMVNPPTMFVLAYLSVLGGDLILFFLGRRYGHHVPRLPLLRHYLTEKRITRAEQYFEDHGGKTLFVARFLLGVRSSIWFAAGTCKIRLWRFLAYDGAAALIFVPILMLLGYFGADQFDRIRQWAWWGQVGIVLGILALIGSVFAFRKFRRKRMSAAAG